MSINALIGNLRKDRLMWITLIVTACCSVFGKLSPASVDWRTIMTLFNLMVCLHLLQRMGILNYAASKLAAIAANTRQLIQLLCLTSFISAMFLTNDVAILTLVPIYLTLVHKHQLPLAYPITLITIAANLGSACTPFGNPQNLIIFNTYQLSLMEFLHLSWPLTVTGMLSLIIATLFITARPLASEYHPLPQLPLHRLWIPLIALIIVFLAIFRIVPIGWAAVIAIISALISDRTVLLSVDYGILITFCGFFLIIGSLSNTPLIGQLIHAATQSPTTVYLSGLAFSQLFSNVPTAILLSAHTSAIVTLFLGVNIGGLGTFVASLANLLAIKQTKLANTSSTKQFLIVFTGVNCLFLVGLGLIGWILSLVQL